MIVLRVSVCWVMGILAGVFGSTAAAMIAFDLLQPNVGGKLMFLGFVLLGLAAMLTVLGVVRADHRQMELLLGAMYAVGYQDGAHDGDVLPLR